jgi:hypothetical protein
MSGGRSRAVRHARQAAGMHTTRALRSMERALADAQKRADSEDDDDHAGPSLAPVVLDPLYELTRVRGMRPLIDRWQDAAVRQARSEGASWQTIAGALGASTQNVHRKYAGPPA